MPEKNFKIEMLSTRPEFDLEELLASKKVPPEITEIIKKHEYLSNSLELINQKLDDYQLTHVLSIAERVGNLSSEILSPEKRDLMVQAAIIHDIGKSQKPEIIYLVTSEGKLDPEGRKKIQDHVSLMVKWCEENNVPPEVIAIAARHHEFVEKERTKNGLNGYPRNSERRTNGQGNGHENRSSGDRRDPKLNNEQIENLGHILHIIDEFDANRQPRSYKEPCSLRLCKKILIDRFPSPADEKIIDALIATEKNTK